MYKLVLCLRYLLTRYIAMASIVSVMLGVATMIVVNSVMAGFSHEMRDRLKALLSDIVIETTSTDGVGDAESLKRLVRESCGDEIAGMTASVELFGMLTYDYAGVNSTKVVTLIGIDPLSRAEVGPLVEHLMSYHDETENGQVVRKANRLLDTPPGWLLTEEARDYRRTWVIRREQMMEFRRQQLENRRRQANPAESRDVKSDESQESAAGRDDMAADPAGSSNVDLRIPLGVRFDDSAEEELAAIPGPIQTVSGQFSGDDAAGFSAPGVRVAEATRPGPAGLLPVDDNTELIETDDPFEQTGGARVRQPKLQDPGEPLRGRVYVGAGLISYPYEDDQKQIRTHWILRPGDDVKITTVSAGEPKPAPFDATIVDVFKSGMSEYDSSLVFVNLEYLQQKRGMIDPQTKLGAVTTIQLKLKDYDRADDVVKKLRDVFPPGLFTIRTWEQKQGPLLAAVDVEATILNVLLFLIITVAGFGILAIFFMIVVEKTRDIGILKALGASSRGILTIFLSYGLSLGVVGAGGGVAAGLVFVHYINQIEKALSWLTGRKVFDDRIYYFPSIPTHVELSMVCWVALGAMSIAVLASILPARRAASLQPVQALRFE